NAESGAAWYGWVPELARRHRVVRPDMRGFGRSTPMPREFPWSLDGLIDDYCRLMDVLGVERFHLVGAKIGGTIARAFAARRPERVATLIVVGSPTPLRVGAAEAAPARAADFEKRGVEPWARESMGGRLGSDFPPAGVEWWIRLMGQSAVSTQVGFTQTIACADIRADVAKISCPTLVITTDGSGLASVEETAAWQRMIPHSELVVLPAIPITRRRATRWSVRGPRSPSSSVAPHRPSAANPKFERTDNQGLLQRKDGTWPKKAKASSSCTRISAPSTRRSSTTGTTKSTCRSCWRFPAFSRPPATRR
ncbi:MAG: alpha/beta fold hydrolase, partial [Xanthobacteraceae bacterium]|nr:alpha/beta fold hydrolase [Xanthobacteraceae bacterium]